MPTPEEIANELFTKISQTMSNQCQTLARKINLPNQQLDQDPFVLKIPENAASLDSNAKKAVAKVLFEKANKISKEELATTWQGNRSWSDFYRANACYASAIKLCSDLGFSDLSFINEISINYFNLLTYSQPRPLPSDNADYHANQDYNRLATAEKYANSQRLKEARQTIEERLLNNGIPKPETFGECLMIFKEWEKLDPSQKNKKIEFLLQKSEDLLKNPDTYSDDDFSHPLMEGRTRFVVRAHNKETASIFLTGAYQLSPDGPEKGKIAFDLAQICDRSRDYYDPEKETYIKLLKYAYAHTDEDKIKMIAAGSLMLKSTNENDKEYLEAIIDYKNKNRNYDLRENFSEEICKEFEKKIFLHKHPNLMENIAQLIQQHAALVHANPKDFKVDISGDNVTITPALGRSDKLQTILSNIGFQKNTDFEHQPNNIITKDKFIINSNQFDSWTNKIKQFSNPEIPIPPAENRQPVTQNASEVRLPPPPVKPIIERAPNLYQQLTEKKIQEICPDAKITDNQKSKEISLKTGKINVLPDQLAVNSINPYDLIIALKLFKEVHGSAIPSITITAGANELKKCWVDALKAEGYKNPESCIKEKQTLQVLQRSTQQQHPQELPEEATQSYRHRL